MTDIPEPVQEAFAILRAMEQSQPGLHTEALTTGFTALWNEKEELRLDRMALLKSYSLIRGELLANIPLGGPDREYDPNDQFREAARDRYERVNEAFQKVKSVVTGKKHDSQIWSELLGVDVKDPDGWDRSSTEAFAESWHERISRAEFLRRMAASTVQVYSWSVLLEK
jgi:hypothetical protein